MIKKKKSQKVKKGSIGFIGDSPPPFCHDLPTEPRPEMGKILVTGASGYIGGRLVPELLARGYSVRIMVRGNRLAYQERWPAAEVVVADALDKDKLVKALEGIHCAYYLIHSLLLGPRDFESADIKAAATFRSVAKMQGIGQIVYLGGLGDCQTSKSRHLRSRARVAEELSDGEVPVTILRAAIIIGSGSASYEIIRHLVSRVRFSLIPHWARNRCQPVGVGDVVKYLVGVMETPTANGRSFDIGGKDILTYERMLKIFAEILNKKIYFVTAPFSAMKFYSYIASLVTPVPARITASLMEGLKDEVVCRNDEISHLIPFEPLTYREAIVRAFTREEQDRVYTRWSDAYPPAHELAIKLHELRSIPTYSASYSILSDKESSSIFKSVCMIGGKNGWFNNNWMWRMRGGVDRIFFGVGSARGRKRRLDLNINDVIDFWRVEDMQNDRRLLLRAEMKLPGKAWLEFNIQEEEGKRRLSTTAFFYTKSLFGKIYWYILLPFHNFIFNDLIEQIEMRSRRSSDKVLN
ncbi:MAG: SDR family oxidoreductase [Proteobacteria bacterium]|nr:SDR family oxidoreductase [Pseudomonadota bacterium]